MKKTWLLSAALLATVGCVADFDGQDVTPSGDDGLEDSLAELDGDSEEYQGELIREEQTPRLTQFSEGRPCGDDTVAAIEVAPAHHVYFCANRETGTAVLETAPLGHPEVVLRDTECAALVHAMLAPGKPIPSALLDECGDSDVKLSLTTPELPELPQTGLPSAEAYASYCSASGQTNFANERCSSVAGWCSSSACTNICRSSSVTWHQRTCASTVGDWCRASKEHIASCNGTTRFLAYDRSKNSSFGLSLDYDVQSGQWASWTIWAPNKAVLFGWKDWDFRYKGDSYGNASHRYATGFWKN